MLAKPIGTCDAWLDKIDHSFCPWEMVVCKEPYIGNLKVVETFIVMFGPVRFFV